MSTPKRLAQDHGVDTRPQRRYDGAPRLLAIDPGDVHVGMAVFYQHTKGKWRCIAARETDPQTFLLWYANRMIEGGFQYVVYERFIVEPGRAQALSGSELETAQMIGVIRWVHSQTKHRWPGDEVVLAGQTNKIKKPTQALLRERKTASQAKRESGGSHAMDAELHGAHYIIHTLGHELTAPTGPTVKTPLQFRIDERTPDA